MSDEKHIRTRLRRKFDFGPIIPDPMKCGQTLPLTNFDRLEIKADKFIREWERKALASMTNDMIGQYQGGCTTIGTDPAANRDWSVEKMLESIELMKAKYAKPSPFITQIVVNKYLCMSTFIRFRRNHRKKRVNKKWHKKYGAITKCESTVLQRHDGTLIMCPCRKTELDTAIKKQPPPTTVS